MDLSLGQAQITLLPGAQAAYEESNDYSIFLELLYGQTSFLFAGDAEETRLAEYLASPDLRRYDVLKVPHHGRACAQSEAFFTSVSPKYAVITCDEEDMPDDSVVEFLQALGAKVYGTVYGQVVLTSDGLQGLRRLRRRSFHVLNNFLCRFFFTLMSLSSLGFIL